MTAHLHLDKLIAKLTDEREALDQIIGSLQRIQSVPTPVVCVKKRRGRTFMGEAERQVVAQRIKAYWAARRKNRDNHLSPTNSR